MRSASYESPDGGDPAGAGAGFLSPSYVTKKLLWANVIVFTVMFLLDRFLNEVGQPLNYWLSLNPEIWYRGIPALWQVWTYGFLHGSPGHILMNMLVLYFFGTMLEAQVGPRRFACQYFAALAVGGLVHLALAPAFGKDSLLGLYRPVVGASGAVLYCVIACAVLMPHARVIFLFVPLSLWVMASILVAMDVFNILSLNSSGTASDVHLAGAALGFVAVRAGWIYFDPKAWWQSRRVQQVAESQATDAQRLDQLLERIHREGIHALSRRDKDFLSRMSKRD